MEKALKCQPIRPKKFRFSVIGTSPLIQHRWTEKAMRMLRMTAAERKKQPKVARDPEQEGIAAMYVDNDGSPAINPLAFKASLVSAAHKDLGIEKTAVRKALFLPNINLIPLSPCSEPVIREDIVKVGQGQTDIRYRPEFSEWGFTITVEVDTEILNQQDIINLVNRAGFSTGIGEWRPERGGEYGRFQFDATQPMEVAE